MKLNYIQIKDITYGAAAVEKLGDGYCFSRFTEEQRALYNNRTEACYLRSLSTSGIKLSFKTNSVKLRLSVSVSPASSRKYFSADVLLNGEYFDSLNNFEKSDIPKKYTDIRLNLARSSKEFYLGHGVKHIEIYLPWSVNAVIEELSIDDGADIEPVKRKNTLLAFGDSITQGYDALHTSKTYVAQLAKALGADEYNKGIGGEIFFPELALTKESFYPDYITVAYGTNDWSHCQKETYIKNCSEFYSNLKKNYPKAKIFAITPIWRSDIDDETPLGKFSELGSVIKNVAKALDITVISGLDLIPGSADLFADLFVHPNEEGFGYYYKNLYRQMLEK